MTGLLRLFSAVMLAVLLSSCALPGGPVATRPTASNRASPSSPDASPGPQFDRPGIAFDSVRGEVVLFGTVYSPGAFGAAGGPPQPNTATAETWIWRAGRWTKQHPASSPPPRTWPSMTYDESRHAVVLFGGQDAVERVPGQGLRALRDTWTWNGGTWLQQNPGASPPAAIGAPFAFDSQLSRSIAVVDAGDMEQTWSWDGSTWAQLHPGVDVPGPRFNEAMAYDAEGATLVLFGRTVCIGPMQCSEDPDTWTFDGATWTKHPGVPGGPAGRSGAAMTYDPSTQEIVMFGGRYSYPVLGDTWIWNGVAWREAHPNVSPWPRTGAIAVYDGTDRKAFLYGGEWNSQSAGSSYYDVWTWDGSAWTLVQPTTTPAPSESQPAIVSAASAAPGLRPLCGTGKSPCMSLHGQAQLGFNAAYVVFDLKPPEVERSQCVSYLSRDLANNRWVLVGVDCGSQNGRMPALHSRAQVDISGGCGNVRAWPLQGPVLKCLPNGTSGTIDDGPVAVGGDPSQGIWWHLEGMGWISHQLLLPAGGT